VIDQLELEDSARFHNSPGEAQVGFRRAGSLETASPAQLREMAAIYREQGMHDLAYDMELAADNREPGEFVELDS
jgi:hypothetical protein